MVSRTQALVFLSLCIATSVTAQFAWEPKLHELRDRTDAFFASLQTIHHVLVSRAEAENPELLPRVSLELPEPREVGYGLLPEVKEAASQTPVKPSKTVYSLQGLEKWIAVEETKADELAAQLSMGADLESLVEKFEPLLDDFRNMEEHLSYHDQWQRSVVTHPLFFQEKNQLLPLAQQLSDLIGIEESAERVQQLRREIVDLMAPFRPAGGIKLRIGGEGGLILLVTVCTDIENSDFLDIFSTAVKQNFSTPSSAINPRFSVDLTWRFFTAMDLYDGSPPLRGDSINMDVHRSLFTACKLVLTTGAADTSAMVGDRIVLGTRPTNPRVLAHEFGHLLGFGDLYLRGYTGEVGSVFGVEIIEWTGLTNDLMGSPGGGQVSDEMIETLIAAYGE